MSVLEAYLRNYDQIAADHVAAWRETGLNPFQDPAVLKENENVTFGNVTRNVAAGGFVLDAGCGMGDLMLRLSDSYDMQGLEIAEPYIEILHERGLEWIKAPIEDMPFTDDLFDAVIAADVLEHVIDLHSAAKELVRVLRPGGHLILRFPNHEKIDQDWYAGYDFVHLRTLDEGTVALLFCRLLGCQFVEAKSDEQIVHLVLCK